MRRSYSAVQMSYEHVYLTSHVWSGVKVVGRGKGTNFCCPIPYKFPSFFNLPLLSKWKMASIIITRKHWAITRQDYLETSRFGHKNLKLTTNLFGRKPRIHNMERRIQTQGSVFFSSCSSFPGKIDYGVLWKLIDCSNRSPKPLWAFRNTSATFLVNANFFFWWDKLRHHSE